MEPRNDVPMTNEASSQAPARRPESRLKTRFSIEPLEERIAPGKGGRYGAHGSTGGAGTPPSYGG